MVEANEKENLCDEIVQFLRPDQRVDIKQLAIHNVLSMTGDFESRRLVLANANLIKHIVQLAFNPEEQKSICKDAFFTLINLSADEVDSKLLMKVNSSLVAMLLKYVMEESSRHADTACAILSNLSRGKSNSLMIFSENFKSSPQSESSDDNNNSPNLKQRFTFDSLLQVFCTEKFNESNKLDYLAPFICNLTQIEAVRDSILSDKLVLGRLLPYTTYERSVLRRGGIMGAIKNCCFNYDYHEMLLCDESVDILSRLLLPLAGPEEFDSDENDDLPLDLQYLPPDKEREVDPDIRCMLIDTLLLLCATKKCRLFLKDKRAYLILRELHKVEKDEHVMLALEKLIHLLIGDEPDRDMEQNLREVNVPEDLAKKFYELERDELDKNFE